MYSHYLNGPLQFTVQAVSCWSLTAKDQSRS